MAKLDGTLENKTIVFTEYDLLLNTWRLQVSSTNPRSLSLLIKAALRHYIRTNTFCCVGKVCIKDPKAEAMKKHTVCMSLSNSPDIIAWLKETSSIGISQAAMIKNVLSRSIEAVEDEDQVWIPSPMELMQIAAREQDLLFSKPDSVAPTRAASHFAQPVHVEDRGKTPVRQQIIPARQEIAQTAEAVEKRAASTNKSPEKKKKPRAASLRGMHFN